MSLDTEIKDKMKGDMSLTSRIAMYIPGYRGYKERSLRKDQDRAVRTELSRTIQAAKGDMASVQRNLVDSPDLMMEAERIRTKLDRYDIDVKKAVNGYSAFHDSIKVTEEDLARVVQWDASLAQDINEMREAVEALMYATDAGEDAKASLRRIERGLDQMINDYRQREAVMRGISEQE